MAKEISAAKGSLIILAATLLMAGLGYWWWQNNATVTGQAEMEPPDPQAVRLYEAIARGDKAEVERVLGERADLLKYPFGSEGTALHVAARLDQPELIALLIARGADPQSRGQWDGTPLHWACWWGSVRSVNELLKHKHDIEDKGDFFGSTPLLWSCHGSNNAPESKGDYRATVQALLDAGAKGDTTNAQGIRAIEMASDAVIELLKSKGVAPPTTRPVPSSQPSGPSLMI